MDCIGFVETAPMAHKLRVALLGEFRADALKDFIPALRDETISVPTGFKGSGIINLVRERIARGLPTDVITLDTKVSRAVTCWESEFVRIWVVRRRARKVVRNAFREERKLLQQALSQTGADICHANWTYEYALAAITQSFMPYIVTVRDHTRNILKWYGYRYLGLYFITQWVLRKARYLTAVSPYIAEYVSIIVKRPIPVVPNPMSDVVWSMKKGPKTVKRSYPVIVSALEWSRLKNVKRALRAFRMVADRFPQARYHLIGQGLDERGEAWNWARKKGLMKQVDFLGPMPYRQTLENISNADALFHPSLEESFGNSVAEAMALNIPVVAAREAGGSRWLLDNGNCGNLVSGRSEDEMGTALLEMLKKTEKVEKSIAFAKNRICNLCDSEGVISAYERIYRQAVKVQKAII